MISVFESVVAAAEEVKACAAGLRYFTAEMEETSAVIRETIKKQKEEDAQRLADLKQVMESATASDTLKRMAAVESRRIAAASYAPTQEELILFSEAKERAETACRDFDAARANFREVYEKAATELAALKAEIFPEREIRGRHRDLIDRAAEGFNRFVSSFNA